jgi:hypothetical protein
MHIVEYVALIGTFAITTIGVTIHLFNVEARDN